MQYASRSIWQQGAPSFGHLKALLPARNQARTLTDEAHRVQRPKIVFVQDFAAAPNGLARERRELQPIAHAAHEGAVKVARGGGGCAIFFHDCGEKETRIQEECRRPEIGEAEVRAQAPRTPGRRPIGDKQIA